MATLRDVELELMRQSIRLTDPPRVVREDHHGGLVRFVMYNGNWTLSVDLKPRDPRMDDDGVVVTYDGATSITIEKHHHEARGFHMLMSRLLSVGFLVDRMERWLVQNEISERL